MNGIEDVVCIHPDLLSWFDIIDDWHYQCGVCGKSVIIPIMDMLIEEDSKHISHQQATHAVRQRAVTMIGQAFGEKWKEHMQREADAWNRKEGIA